MSNVPHAKGLSPVVIAALETKSLPAADVLVRMTPHEQLVVVAYAKLFHHLRSAAPVAKKTLRP